MIPICRRFKLKADLMSRVCRLFDKILGLNARRECCADFERWKLVNLGVIEGGVLGEVEPGRIVLLVIPLVML